MTRKRRRRQVIVPMPPRGMRPRLDAGQTLDLALAHMTNLDLVSKGQAGPEVMWQMLGGVFTWHRVAELMPPGTQVIVADPDGPAEAFAVVPAVDAMRAQLELVTGVVERYGRTRRVGFSGPEYQLDKVGVDVMDQLAAVVDRATAVAAADWSEARVNALEATYAQMRAETA